MRNRHWWLIGLIVAGVSGAAVAAPPTAEQLEEVAKLHERIGTGRGTIAIEEGRAALEQVKRLDVALDELTPADRAKVLQVQVYASLAIGDVRGAQAALAQLEKDGADSPDTLRARWSVAAVAGDAEKALRTLETLHVKGIAPGRSVGPRMRQLDLIGEAASDQIVRAEGGQSVALRERKGRVLVIDFWSVAQKPEEAEVEALRRLYEVYGKREVVDFLGINADAPERVEAAQAFAKDNGYTWAQHYERSTGDAPLTVRLFKVAEPPWVVLVDGFGNIRTVRAARDPVFEYAVRAAVAEAKGEYAAVMPVTREGRAARAPDVEAAQPAVRSDPRPTAEPAPELPPSELPSSPEAKKMLDEARLFAKTGKKTDARRILRELIEQYPGTQEAEHAKTMLEYL